MTSGTANAFILVPIILSLIGPTPDYKDKAEDRKTAFLKRMDTLSKQQVLAMHFQYRFKHPDSVDEKNQPDVLVDVSDFSDNNAVQHAFDKEDETSPDNRMKVLHQEYPSDVEIDM